MDLGLAVEGQAELCSPGVESAEVGCGNALVQDIAQELMPEVDPVAVAPVIEIGALDQLGDGPVQIRDRPLHDAREHRRDEAPTDDRAGPGNLTGLG
jgi:hypothetical protein